MGLAGIPVPNLLSQLYEAEFRAVCEALGVSTIGRSRAVLERLIVHGRTSTAPVHPAPRAPGHSGGAARRSFVALDFKTADNGRDSACALAVVRVDSGTITESAEHLIQPPRRIFLHTAIHGIRWADVQFARPFDDVWSGLNSMFLGVDFIAAHNCGFEKSVVRACCSRHLIAVLKLPYLNTVMVAR